MGMQQQTPRPRKSPWVRYAPFIAVVVVVAVIVVVAVAVSGGNDNKNKAVVSGGTTTPKSDTVPVFYNDAKAKGELDKYTWQSHCDTATGEVAIPILDAPPCVPTVPQASNAGATSPGVTADTIKIGYYIPKPDPIGDSLLKLTGAYDSPEATANAYKKYVELYAGNYELYGRKIDLVKVQGTGSISDAVAARADADRAAADGVFAVIGGPAQAKQFSDELAAKHILCIAGCIVAQPQKYYLDHMPYMWPGGPSPDQTSSMVAELIKKQLVGKPVQWAGPALMGKKRTFTLLTYDTPDGQFKSSWDDLEQKIKATGADVVAHVNYYLNFATLEPDARTTAAKLQQAGATDIIFTGDPLFPKYLTAEMTKNGYFPEWVMSGTVFADTNVFARSFDQKQWVHAFGLQLIPARLPKDKQDAYTVYKWWYGPNAPLPSENNYAVVKGGVEELFNGLQLAGPKLTPDTFKAGMDAFPPAASPDQPTRQDITTYGDHGFWPDTPDDPAGLDNAGILWWDPNASGADETGTQGKGMYRLVDGGLRYLPGHWPTQPVNLFDPANTITIYGEDNIPPELLPPNIPVPADAPAKS